MRAPLTAQQKLQAPETSSPVLLGRERKGVVVAVVVVAAGSGLCLWRALQHVVVTSLGQGGVEVVAAAVVDVGLGAHLDHR
jgi:hypothetical protein